MNTTPSSEDIKGRHTRTCDISKCLEAIKSVRIFLVDGTPQGLRVAEVGNWTGLALVCPRTNLSRIGQRNEARRTGIYVLIGSSEASPSQLAVYVGEGDEVWARLRSHDVSKEFWTWVVIFVSKDDNLTKTHVRWLEAALIRDMRSAKRVAIENANEPFGGPLPEADISDMETYLENIHLLLPILGADVFSVTAAAAIVATTKQPPLFEMKWENCHAECGVRVGKFVVQQGSTARTVEVNSLGANA